MYMRSRDNVNNIYYLVLICNVNHTSWEGRTFWLVLTMLKDCLSLRSSFKVEVSIRIRSESGLGT